MDQHPIPRQITTFEFKLIGFLTIKQFIYLIVFVALGFAVYGLFPIPIINILLGLTVAGIGAAFAFLPINDRPLDIWVKNLIKRLTSPTQYQFKKNNPPPAILVGLVSSNPTTAASHLESQQKLSNYLGGPPNTNLTQKQSVNNLLHNPPSILTGKKTASAPAATFGILEPGEYFFELKDPQEIHFFDTMKIKVEKENHTPIEILSKELI